MVPAPRSCPFAPPAEYQRRREEAPASRVTLPNGRPAWAVTRHEDVRALLTDPRFSSDRSNPASPRCSRAGRPAATSFTALADLHGPARARPGPREACSASSPSSG